MFHKAGLRKIEVIRVRHIPGLPDGNIRMGWYMVDFGELNFYEPILTARESDVMEILWTSGRSLSAAEISKSMENLSLNTARAVVRKLMKRGLVEVGDIVYSQNVLCRTFRSAITKKEFVQQAVAGYLKTLDAFDVSRLQFVLKILDEMFTDNELDEIEKFIKNKKKK